MFFRGEYHFLSNFSPSIINYHGKTYTCVESAFQAQKSLDDEIQRQFAAGGPFSQPLNAKRAGKTILLRQDWEDVKDSIMLDLLRLKFSNPGLKAKLLATGDQKIIEENAWNDTYWGVCRGMGQNRLGVLLMQVREEYSRVKSREPVDECDHEQQSFDDKTY